MSGWLWCAGVAGYSTYAPSKAALRSLADTLRNEVWRSMHDSQNVLMQSSAFD